LKRAAQAQLQRQASSSSLIDHIVQLAAARIAIARRDFATAALLYEAALAQDPDDAETCYLLGLVYVSMNDLVSARKYLEQAVTLDPTNDAARSALAAVTSRLPH